MGSDLGVLFSHYLPEYHTPTRARAYNDLHKDAVLLKTASKHVQGVRDDDPKMGPILGCTDSTRYVVLQAIRAYPYIHGMCGYMP